MNIKITHNWLLEYLDTKATPEEIQKYLSLCGPSVESVTKSGDDYIYDIEITSNRIDTASVVGIAREAYAILNRFGVEAKLKNIIVPEHTTQSDALKLRITDDQKLCYRVVSVVMDNVQIKKSPQFITDRLEAVGIRSLNNIIDLTNYVMIEYGHPTHVMDYDRIKTGTLIIRKAKKGETSVTLDGKKHTLSEKDVIADDGTGRIVDLLGIMGVKNSVVTDTTTRAVLFIEANNPHIIRHTSMNLGIRTVAATYDEKEVDPELTKTALNRLMQLFEKYAGAHIASKPIDIYHSPKKNRILEINYSIFEKLIGVKIEKRTIQEILSQLGFVIKSGNEQSDILKIEVPSYRSHDISIPEDIVEEVARIYGYFNLPNNLQSAVYIKQPKEMERLFATERKVKYFLKNLGLHEVINYSMISEDLIKRSDLDVKKHLILKNTISEEIKYLRTHLMPSLIKNIRDNQGKEDILRFFEIAKTYKPRPNELPLEEYKLGIVTNTDYYDLKGIIDALLREFNIVDYTVSKSTHPLLSEGVQGQIAKNKDWIGEFGQLKTAYQEKNGITGAVFIAVFDLGNFIKHAQLISSKYRPINPYATIKLDLTFAENPKMQYYQIKEAALKKSSLLTDIEYLGKYKNNITLRFYFSSPKRNITEEEAKEELAKICNMV